MLKLLLFIVFLAGNKWKVTTATEVTAIATVGSGRCGPYQRWVQCPIDCLPKKCSDLGFPVPCPTLAPDQSCATGPGCICIVGYLKNDKGICVPSKQCPSCGGDKNAESGCGNCPKTCHYNGTQPTKCPEFCKTNGCNCKKGFFLDVYTNKCITPEQCKLCRGPNEHYTNCPDDCLPKKCSELGFPIACPGLTVDGSCPSKPGCVCNSGYVRNDNGTCIEIKKCPSCGGDSNAQNGCGNCPKTCKNYNSTEPQICPKYCNTNGCDCKPGFVLDEKTNICIRPAQCYQCKKQNEHYDPCPDDCEPQKCSQLGFPILCPATATKVCAKPACVCDDGFKRDDKGNCIPIAKCPSCGGDKNAESGCGSCQKTCKNYNSTIPPICNRLCIRNGCICKHGYVLDENTRICVRPEKCTPTCGIGEYFDLCSNGGCHDARTCKDLDTLDGSYICEDRPKCKPGCLCKNNFLRNKQGKCVPENECPNSKCKGDFETFVKCDINCLPERCDQIGFPINCTIPQPGSCCPGKPKCICRNGYVRDKTGKCILKDQCPSCGGDPNAKPGCGTNCGKHCSDYGKSVSCPFSCIINGCECKDGFYLDDNIRKCVPLEKCSPKCGQNEKYTPCLESVCSGPRNCSQISCGKTVPVICKYNIPIKCTAGCICEDGYLKNNNGICVLKEECPLNDQCSGKQNEFFDTCPPMCLSETCDSLRNPYICLPKAAVCRPRCRCAQGTYRNYKGVCVPERQCKCPKNEVYDPCPDPCPPQLCSVDENTIRCADPPNLGDPACKPGCRCEYGYKRNNRGECIPASQCPKICRGINQIYDPCPSACDYDYCENIGKDLYCPPQSGGCKPGACVCKPGYLKNKIGECILKANCLRCTGPNEYYSCGGACDNVCATLSQQNQTNCPIINIKCNEMCYCEKGYARNSKGICVPISSCPNYPCPKGQTLGCGNNCNRKCFNYRNGPSPCPRIVCTKDSLTCQCDSSQGYYYDDYKKECVYKTECPYYYNNDD